MLKSRAPSALKTSKLNIIDQALAPQQVKLNSFLTSPILPNQVRSSINKRNILVPKGVTNSKSTTRLLRSCPIKRLVVDTVAGNKEASSTDLPKPLLEEQPFSPLQDISVNNFVDKSSPLKLASEKLVSTNNNEPSVSKKKRGRPRKATAESTVVLISPKIKKKTGKVIRKPSKQKQTECITGSNNDDTSESNEAMMERDEKLVCGSNASKDDVKQEVALATGSSLAPSTPHTEPMVWYCRGCDKEHGKVGKTALSSFCRQCGWVSQKVATDGDCFFNAVNLAMSNGENNAMSVIEQRQAVSDRMTDDMMDTYKMLAEANPEDEYLNFLRPQPVVKLTDIVSEGNDALPPRPVRSSTRVRKKMKVFLSEECLSKNDYDGEIDEEYYKAVNFDGKENKEGCIDAIEAGKQDVEYADPLVSNLEEFKQYLLREGVEHGAEGCIWADEFAHKVIAELTNLAIVFIDMERSSGNTPYRLLACSQQPTHLIILKRKGPVGHFSYIRQTDGTSSFMIDSDSSSGGLPPIVKVLWEEGITELAKTQPHVAKLKERIYGVSTPQSTAF